MELEGPVVHIGAAHQRQLPVRQNALGVEEAGGVAVDLHPVAQQLPPVGLRHHVGHLLVRDARHHQPDIHPGVGGDAQGLLHGGLHGVVGGGEVEHPPGLADDLEIGLQHRVVGVILRPVAEGLAVAFPRRGLRPGAVVVQLVGQLPADHPPHADKLQREAPGGVPLDPDAGILPVAEAADAVGVLVADVDAPGIGPVPVDDGDLPVVPVVEVEPVHVLVDGVEDLQLDAAVLDGLQHGVRESGDVAEVVEDDLDLHPGGGPLPQDGEDPVPDLPLRQDVVLQEDVRLGLSQMLDEVVEKRRPVREVVGVGIPVEPEIPLLKVGGHPSPVGELPAQPGEVGLAGLDDGAPLRGHGDPPQAEVLGLAQPAPEAEEDDARHRHEKQQAHPAELVGGAPRAGVDPDGKARAHQLQRAVNIAGPLLQQGRKGQGGEDLQKKQQHAEGQPPRGGDPPLDALLAAGSFRPCHGVRLPFPR